MYILSSNERWKIYKLYQDDNNPVVKNILEKLANLLTSFKIHY